MIAKFNFGLYYARGIGISKDLAMAQKYLEEAKAMGHKKAPVALERVKERRKAAREGLPEPQERGSVFALEDSDDMREIIGMAESALRAMASHRDVDSESSKSGSRRSERVEKDGDDALRRSNTVGTTADYDESLMAGGYVGMNLWSINQNY